MKNVSGTIVSGTSNTAILPASDPGAGAAPGSTSTSCPVTPVAGVWPEYGM